MPLWRDLFEKTKRSREEQAPPLHRLKRTFFKVLFAYFFSERKSKSVCVFLLECCADCVCAGCGVAGTYVDGCGCASAFAVVVNAVGNVANNAVIAFAGVFFVFVIHHIFKTPFCEFIYILYLVHAFIHRAAFICFFKF